MYYEINVSLNGKHYFATSDRSIRTKEKAQEMALHFREVFPESQGYDITVSHYETIGHRLEI